ncbi:hypothetical protein TNCV_1657581 [Trichonephila clavipes]|nr:hypothetical protein TNCV_1657581 [Trichonephila clavipes]
MPYRYDRVKQSILDNYVEKMLKEGPIIPIQSLYVSPVVLCRKNNGLPPNNPEAYRFAVDYRKLNAITKYPRYPLPLTDDLITNISHSTIMSSLDLHSGYFQLVVKPSDIVKKVFVTKHSGVRRSGCEVRVYISQPLRSEIMREFHDKTIAGHLGRFKTYHKIRDVCCFLYIRKSIEQYVSTCNMCKLNNYKNALPDGRLISIVTNYPNKIVTLDLLGSRVRRKRYVLVITDHFSKWTEIIPLKKASAKVIADSLFDNYISRYGAPIKMKSDKVPQVISDIFEHLSNRLGIRPVKTVVYRPQANRTERVNRDLVQMIANYVKNQHDTWDQFLSEFAYAIRTAVNETTGKTPAELFKVEN